MVLSPNAFREFLDPELHTYVLGSIRAGLADYSNPDFYSPEARLCHTAATRATIRRDHIVSHATRAAALLPQVQVEKRGNRIEFILKGGVRIIFKLLNNSQRPSYSRTRQAVAYLHQHQPDVPVQLTFPFLQEIFQVTNLVAGYQVDAVGEGAEIFVVCPDGRTNKWALRLTGGEITQIVEIVEPAPVVVAKPRVVVRSKTERGKETISGGDS